jgi:G3E family GTPase
MLKAPVRLNVIYAIVGAHMFKKNITDNEIYTRQIIFADLILLNQVDRLEEKELQSVEDELREVNPTAKIIRTKYCDIPMDELFSLEHFNQIKQESEELPVSHDHEHHHAHPDHNIQYIFVEFDKPFEQSKLDQQIATLLWEQPEEMTMLRCKGLIHIANSLKKFSLQG